MRALVLALLALVLAAPAAGAHGRDRDLTVVAYNIHHGAGLDGAVDLDRIAGEIRAARADVALLQEVDRHWGERSGWADQPAELARRLRMHVVYGANLDLDPPAAGEPRRQYGTAILSRYPILDWRNTLLPRPANGEQRGLLEAVLSVRGARMRVANTHLQHNSQLERTVQAQRIDELLGGAHEPVVLGGDLNAVPEAPELAPLLARFADAGATAGPTYPAEAPDRRIDYVLVSRVVRVRRAEVRPTLASDHLPVVAELAVRRR